MPKQGTGYLGPLAIKEGGLQLYDPVRVGINRCSEERYARLVLTSAQLLAAVGGTTFFQIAPAPGANKFYEFLTGNLIMRHGGTAYTGTGSARICATVSASTAYSAAFALNSFDGASGDIAASIPSSTSVLSLPINQPIGLAWLSGAPAASLTGGNGTLIVLVSYRIQDASL